MVDFNKYSQKNDLHQGSRPGEAPKAARISDIVTAEYSFFYIHQIKAWAGWSVSQEEIDYTIDPPIYLNA